MKGKLFLIPAVIGETETEMVIPAGIVDVINNIRFYIVENERTARRQLIQYGIKRPINELTFFLLNEHTDRNQLAEYLKPCTDEHVGLLSEAGVPAVADPGSDVVALAHQKQIQVVPLVGPSSILLALMASGMNGQHFTFHGYLPVKPHERAAKIKEIEHQSLRNKQTQIFIEAPYRNNQLLSDLIQQCAQHTRICVACHITQADEFIKTLTVAEWKKNKPELHKKPTIFLLQA